MSLLKDINMEYTPLTDFVIRKRPKKPKPPLSIHTGMRFKLPDGNIYILALIEPRMVCLISLSNGNRNKDPVLVEDNLNINGNEFEEISASTLEQIALVTEY